MFWLSSKMRCVDFSVGHQLASAIPSEHRILTVAKLQDASRVHLARNDRSVPFVLPHAVLRSAVGPRVQL